MLSHHPLQAIDIATPANAGDWLRDKASRLGHSLQRTNFSFRAPEGFCLSLDKRGLGILCPSLSLKPFILDYTQGPIAYRNQHASYRKEGLAKALGRNPAGLRCLDVTGGYAHDSVLLATLGAQMTTIERHPWIAALVCDALIRASTHPLYHAFTKTLDLINMNAIDYIHQAIEAQHKAIFSDENSSPNFCFDVVICDPMFPNKQKDSLAKLDMQLLQALGAPPTIDEEVELLMACQMAAPRVVVKRPLHAPFLGECTPHHSTKQQTVRWDIYLSQALI